MPQLPNFNARKFTIFAIVVVIIVVVALLVVALVMRPTRPPLPPTPPEVTLPLAPLSIPGAQLPTTTPLTPGAPIKAVTELPPIGGTDIALAQNGNGLVGYNPLDGTLYRVDANGNLILLTDEKFPYAQKVTWSPDRSKAILEFPDAAKILYNLQTKKQITLPRHWQEFSFSPTSDGIVFKSLGLDPENQWLAIATPDGSNVVPLEQLGERAFLVQPTWSPSGQVVGLYTKPLDSTRSTLFFLGPNREQYPSTTIEGMNFTGTWSPNGQRLLYSVATAQTGWKPTLWMVGAEGSQMGTNRTPLSIQTWADKCVFRSGSIEKLLCAVPQELPNGAGLVRDSVEQTSDHLVEIDLGSGFQRTLPTDALSTVDQLVLSDDGKTAFVRERQSSAVKKINL